jgi:hypothetical protein
VFVGGRSRANHTPAMTKRIWVPERLWPIACCEQAITLIDTVSASGLYPSALSPLAFCHLDTRPTHSGSPGRPCGMPVGHAPCRGRAQRALRLSFAPTVASCARREASGAASATGWSAPSSAQRARQAWSCTFPDRTRIERMVRRVRPEGGPPHVRYNELQRSGGVRGANAPQVPVNTGESEDHPFQMAGNGPAKHLARWWETSC